MESTRLNTILNAFGGLSVAVMGDMFLDRLLVADRRLDETSVETGLTAYQIVERKCTPGGGGVLTNNLATLGAKRCYGLGVWGSDGEAKELRNAFSVAGCDTSFFITEPGRFTPTYTKLFFRDGDRLTESNRTDFISRSPIRKDTEKHIIEALSELENRVDAIICLEQRKQVENGIFTDAVLNKLSDIAARGKIKVFADSRYGLNRFEGVITKCNDNEFLRLNGISAPFDAPLTDERLQLLLNAVKRFRINNKGLAFVSVGAAGMLVFNGAGYTPVPTLKAEGPIDICGAGDSALAGIALAMCAGAAPEEAALIGNLVAAAIIRQIGVTGTATREDITDNFFKYQLQESVL